MKYCYSLVCIALVLGVTQAHPGDPWEWIKGKVEDAGEWVEGAAHDVRDFLTPDQLKDNIVKLWNSEEFKLAKGVVSRKCHWKATAKCTPEAVEIGKKKGEEIAASEQKPSKIEILKFATKVATDCWIREVKSC